MKNKKKIKDCEHKNIFGTGFTNWYSEIECIECGEKVEQEPTCDCLCRGCDIGCSKCFWKGTNKFVCQPKTEGRELITKWLELNKPYYKKQNIKVTSSPKQDTWESRFDKLKKDWFNFPEITEIKLKKFFRSELQNQRQEYKDQLERLKLEVDVNICECGEKWSETDIAMHIKRFLDELDKE